MRRLSREKTDKSQIVKQNRTYVHQLDMPCPFLGSDELCTIYNIRPIKCHTYPFNITEPFSSFMQIFPCMMGKKISKDFVEYMIFKMEKTNDIGIHQAKLEVSSFLENLDERSELFFTNTDGKVKTLGAAFHEIFSFSDYLNTMKTARK